METTPTQSLLSEKRKKKSFSDGSPLKSRRLETQKSINVVGLDSIEIESSLEIRDAAKSVMNKAMETGELRTRDQCYGNPAGLQLFRRLDELEKKNAEFQNQIHGHENQFQKHENQIRELQENSEGYLKHRNRFLDVYCRDFLKDTTKTDQIREGNKIVHSANALADMQLYLAEKRDDFYVFERLYGLPVHKVSVLKEGENRDLINLIDDMATMKVKEVEIPKNLERCFRRLVSLIMDESTVISNNLEDGSHISEAVLEYRRLKTEIKSG